MIRNHQHSRGFTFLEIMFVVVIIGILLAVAVPQFTGRSQEAQIRAAEVSMRNISTALAEFEMRVGRFPTTNEGLGALVERPPNVSENVWRRPFLDETPRDPWGNEFHYRSPGQHRPDSYDLWSAGPDGQEGTDDDIRNWRDR